MARGALGETQDQDQDQHQHQVDDAENHSLSSNLPEEPPPRSPIPPPHQSPALKSKYLSKRSEEIQLERPKLTPKKSEPLRLRRGAPALEKKEFSPKPSKTLTRSAAAASSDVPQTKSKTHTPQKVADPKPTYQQRMEAWLKTPERAAEAPNPFLAVLEDK
jgi:hypothetical protein